MFLVLGGGEGLFFPLPFLGGRAVIRLPHLPVCKYQGGDFGYKVPPIHDARCLREEKRGIGS